MLSQLLVAALRFYFCSQLRIFDHFGISFSKKQSPQHQVMSLWRCHLKNWWTVYSSFPLQKQLMRSPGEIEPSGRNAHLMHKCIVNSIASRVFCGFSLGFLAWRAVVHGRGRAFLAAMPGWWSDQPNLQLVWQILSFGLFIYDSVWKEQRVVTCIHHTHRAVSRKPIFQGHERGHSAASSESPSVMQRWRTAENCQGAKAGGSQQTRLNPWDFFCRHLQHDDTGWHGMIQH